MKLSKNQRFILENLLAKLTDKETDLREIVVDILSEEDSKQSKAVERLQKICDQHTANNVVSAPYLNILAWMYEAGLFVARDLKKAFELYQQVAMQGNAGEQNNLGVMYKNGQGVAQDVDRLSLFMLKQLKKEAFLMSVISGAVFNRIRSEPLK